MVVQGVHREVVGYGNVKADKFNMDERLTPEDEDLIDPFLLTDPFDVTYTMIWEKNLLQQH